MICYGRMTFLMHYELFCTFYWFYHYLTRFLRTCISELKFTKPAIVQFWTTKESYVPISATASRSRCGSNFRSLQFAGFSGRLRKLFVIEVFLEKNEYTFVFTYIFFQTLILKTQPESTFWIAGTAVKF